MMIKNLLLLLIGLSAICSLKANILVVDNNYPSIGDFTTLEAAHDAANNGDTLYVYPSSVCYEAISLTKQLAIIGAGWESPQAGINVTSICDTVIFQTNSDGSALEGFGGWFSVIIESSNVSISRNKIRNMLIKSNSQSIFVSQNYFSNWGGLSALDNIEMENNTEAYITNNLFHNSPQDNTFCINAGSSNTNVSIVNNIFDAGYDDVSPINALNATQFIANNIITKGENCVGVVLEGCYNNMCNAGQFPGGNNNLLWINMETVFIDYSNYDFHLKVDGPAKGYGLNGVDLGIYGGDFPFVDGGYPGIPSIYFLDVPATGSQQDGLDVMIKVRSNQ